MLKITKYFPNEAATRLWRIICCWQLGVIFLCSWAGSSFDKFWFLAVGFFARLGNVLDSEGLAFLVKT